MPSMGACRPFVNTDTITALQQSGFDILSTREAKLSTRDDEDIFNFALKSKRILLTFDRGFGDIFRFPIQKSAGVIIILVHHMSKKEIIKITTGFLNSTAQKILKGKLVIIGKRTIRIIER